MKSKRKNKGSQGSSRNLTKGGNTMAAPTRFVNPNAEVVSKTQALMVNVAAARGLQNVLKTNLGERETYIMRQSTASRTKIYATKMLPFDFVDIGPSHA